MTTWLLAVTPVALLTVFDLWISHKRWKLGIRDLNPVVQHFVKQSPACGLLALTTINVLVITIACLYRPLILVLLGGKLTLASLQLRSLYEYRNPQQSELRK